VDGPFTNVGSDGVQQELVLKIFPEFAYSKAASGKFPLVAQI
jgi:hypothetical protein